MNARLLAVRAPILAALAVALTLHVARSSLRVLLPEPAPLVPWPLWALTAFALLLLPALLARGSPLPRAAVVTVPALAIGAYGASRLDWLRVLKDFGVQEAEGFSVLRALLGAAVLALLWALHAADVATRLRAGAGARGIEPAQARAAGRRSARRSAEAGGVALAGAAGLAVVGLLGVRLGEVVPAERAAFALPLLAASVLLAAAVWLARSSRAA